MRYYATDTELEIRALAVWGRTRYLSVMEAFHNQYWIFASERGRNIVSLKLKCQSGVWSHNLRLSKQAALTTAQWPRPLLCLSYAHTYWVLFGSFSFFCFLCAKFRMLFLLQFSCNVILMMHMSDAATFVVFCETQWPRPPLFSPSWQSNTMKYGGGFLYNLVFTEWRHCVSQNEVWGRGCYITLFSPRDVTAFHRMNRLRLKCGQCVLAGSPY